jgi:hypothetical protein
MVSCHARLVVVGPDAGPAGGAAVHLSAVEVRALWNILGLVAAGGSLTEKPEREMARRLQTELALSFHRGPAAESRVSGSSAAGSLKSSHWTAPDFGRGCDPCARRREISCPASAGHASHARRAGTVCEPGRPPALRSRSPAGTQQRCHGALFRRATGGQITAQYRRDPLLWPPARVLPCSQSCLERQVRPVRSVRRLPAGGRRHRGHRSDGSPETITRRTVHSLP